MTFPVVVWPLRATRVRTSVAVVWVVVVLFATSWLAVRVSGGGAVACWVIGGTLAIVPTTAVILTLRQHAQLAVTREGLSVAPQGGLRGALGRMWRWPEISLRVERREDGDILSIRPHVGEEWLLSPSGGGRLDDVVDAIRAAGGRVERQLG